MKTLDVIHVSVYCEDGRTESYFFENLQQVRTSISITWSQKLQEIKVHETDLSIIVTDGNGTRLLYARHPTVLNGATHF